MRALKQYQISTHHPIHSKNIMGSMKRIHRDGYFITDSKTGDTIDNILLAGKIREEIHEEEKAWEIIRDLRDRCIKPRMHNPTDGELRDVLQALRTLWLLLPPIKRQPGEKSKTFFLRTLHEINRFRGIDMFI